MLDSGESRRKNITAVWLLAARLNGSVIWKHLRRRVDKWMDDKMYIVHQKNKRMHVYPLLCSTAFNVRIPVGANTTVRSTSLYRVHAAHLDAEV